MAGEYTGIIPDEKTHCAKLYSDCNNLEIMFYTVYACYNRSSIFEGELYTFADWGVIAMPTTVLIFFFLFNSTVAMPEITSEQDEVHMFKLNWTELYNKILIIIATENTFKKYKNF